MTEVKNTIRIDFIFVDIIIMLCWYLAESAGHFWQPEKFENVANPDFNNLKHLQNLGNFCWSHLVLYLLFMSPYCNATVPLVKHFILLNVPIYGVSYLKAELSLIVNLSPIL